MPTRKRSRKTSGRRRSKSHRRRSYRGAESFAKFFAKKSPKVKSPEVTQVAHTAAEITQRSNNLKAYFDLDDKLIVLDHYKEIGKPKPEIEKLKTEIEEYFKSCFLSNEFTSLVDYKEFKNNTWKTDIISINSHVPFGFGFNPLGRVNTFLRSKHIAIDNKTKLIDIINNRTERLFDIIDFRLGHFQKEGDKGFLRRVR